MTSTKRSYFDAIYESDPDPWGFATREYEQRKYAVTIASLPRPRYRAAFEPGCSIGIFTQMLAARCDALLATDVVPAALRQASERLRRSAHVVVESRAIPEEWPQATFDLIVLSEIAYYFDEADLEHIVSLALGSMAARAHLIAVHWRGETDYPLSGDRAHEIIDSTLVCSRLVHHVESNFVLDVWERRP